VYICSSSPLVLALELMLVQVSVQASVLA